MSEAPLRRAKVTDVEVSAEKPAARRVDGLTYDRAAALRHLRKVSPAMRSLIEAAGPFTVQPEEDIDPFPYLLRSIVFQQLNGTAAGTIHGRLLGLYEHRVPTPEQLLATDIDTLRSVGLSGNKALAVLDLAEHARAGELPTHAELPTLPDLEIVDRLTRVRGIGPWTVHMVLLFHLGRPDVLPTGDFGVREGYRLLHGLEVQPTPTAFRELTLDWRPYRSVASWYMYRAVDVWREGILPTV